MSSHPVLSQLNPGFQVTFQLSTDRIPYGFLNRLHGLRSITALGVSRDRYPEIDLEGIQRSSLMEELEAYTAAVNDGPTTDDLSLFLMVQGDMLWDAGKGRFIVHLSYDARLEIEVAPNGSSDDYPALGITISSAYFSYDIMTYVMELVSKLTSERETDFDRHIVQGLVQRIS